MTMPKKPELELVLHNIRSAHNVGALFRTADGLGVEHIYLSGYTPYPMSPSDHRLPHVAKKTTAAISKTALGAESTVVWSHYENLSEVADKTKARSATLVALEQDAKATLLHNYNPPAKITLVLGNEVTGLTADELQFCEEIVQLPMLGSKESFNVASAGAMALHWLRFCGKM